MKLLIIILFLFLIHPGCVSDIGSSDAASRDTCSHHINVPPDIDMPQTAHFDTTIERGSDCKVNVLVLSGWGTQTSYILSPEDTALLGKYKPRHTEFSAGEQGRIDISDLPEGVYTMHLMACGNGGFFTVRIK